MELKIPIEIVFDDVNSVIDELGKLQKYKMCEGDDMTFVDVGDVVDVLTRHVMAREAKEPYGTKEGWIPCSGDMQKDDVIYRQAAIDAAKELCLHYTPTKSVKHPHIDFVVEELERLPSAHQRWIPCSERLPRTEDFMIITILDDGGDIPIIYSDFGWYASVGGFWVVDNETRKDVIAWMPLPEPYRGESDE